MRKTKSEYNVGLKAMQDEVASIGHNGELMRFSKTQKLLPLDEIVARINSLQHNKKDCDFSKSTDYLRMQLSDYQEVWLQSRYTTPPELEELVDKSRAFFTECDCNPSKQ